MPGLFGMLTLKPGTPLDRESHSALLDEMADRLQHVGLEQMRRWADWQLGVAVACIGPSEFLDPSWPEETGAREAPAVATGQPIFFLDGVLHPDSPTADDLLREADPPDAEIARRLEGFWSGVCYRPGTAGNGRDRRLSVIVDRRSQRQLFWTVKDGILFFAPEVKSLLAVPGLDRTPDPGAMGIFFASGFLLADQTFFPAIRRLEGGTLLTVAGEEPRIERYADYRFTVEGDGTPYPEICRLLGERMREVVARNYTDPEHDLVFLSGGKDSRIILASAVGAAGDASKVRAVSWTSNDPQPGSDVFIAQQIAADLGVDLKVIRRSTESYHAKSLRLTYVLDGLTDVGTFHGEELHLMEELSQQGVRKVLRGDQCFTRGRSMLSPAYAILRMCIRSTSGLADGRSSWQSAVYEQICSAGDAQLEALAAEYANVQEDNTGDEVYFRHRLQGYLNSAVYFKLLHFDHRNPLLDERMLRLIQRLSIAARREQKVLNEAGALEFPEVWGKYPFADRSNLEDFVDLLAHETPVRRAVRAEFSDESSAVWEFLDRGALLGRLEGLGGGGSSSWKSRLKKTLKNTVARAVYDIPAVDVRLRGHYLRRATRDDEVLLRALTLKYVFDLFVTGDGSRAAYEQKLSRLEAGHD